MEFGEFFKAATARVIRKTFEAGEDHFEVELKLCNQADLDRIGRVSTTKVFDDKTRSYRDEMSADKVREYLRDECLRDWSDLTFGKAIRLCNLEVRNGVGEHGTKALTFSPAHADLLLKHLPGFQAWVLGIVTKSAADLGLVDEGSKKNSGTTSAGS